MGTDAGAFYEMTVLEWVTILQIVILEFRDGVLIREEDYRPPARLASAARDDD